MRPYLGLCSVKEIVWDSWYGRWCWTVCWCWHPRRAEGHQCKQHIKRQMLSRALTWNRWRLHYSDRNGKQCLISPFDPQLLTHSEPKHLLSHTNSCKCYLDDTLYMTSQKTHPDATPGKVFPNWNHMCLCNDRSAREIRGASSCLCLTSLCQLSAARPDSLKGRRGEYEALSKPAAAGKTSGTVSSKFGARKWWDCSNIMTQMSQRSVHFDWGS